MSDADAPAPGLLRQVGLPYFVIAFIARLPFAMMVVGVLTLVVSARGSLSLGGLNSAAVGLGTACFGPLLGAASDRFGQRPVLLTVGIANGIVLAGFAWLVYSPVPDAVMLVGAFLIGATAPQVAPLSRARLVTIIALRIDRRRRERVFNSTMAYESAADETVFVFGPFIVGILASLLSPWAPLVGAAVLTVVFVSAFALHPTAPPAQTRSHGTTAGPVSELFRPALVVVVVGILGVGFFFGAMLTALTAFMEDRGISEQAGLLYGVMGIGSASLALGVAVFPERFTRAWRWLSFGAVIFVGSLALPFVSGIGGMAVVLAIMGLGIGPTLVTQYSIGAERSPVGRSSTVMAILGSAVIVGQSLSSAVTGELAQRFGTPAALIAPIVSAAVVVAAGVANLVLSRSAQVLAQTQPSGNVPDSRNAAS
ncbi:MFS transporter [Microbacterium horticulturae]|uniref:MFS transporter n=1 Tax=Microbacterium horticulturae TaxID=3028316 RepID=A0ABY8C4K7_9MICO|nr:MFS transporter [Microbacterium sp. KACC 23027]WEG10110.1 MFS transporter [Microbacterium sp. KACC 23027]